MAKKLKVESFTYHFLTAVKEFGEHLTEEKKSEWHDWVNSLNFAYDKGDVRVEWEDTAGHVTAEVIDLKKFQFYVRGDDAKACLRQGEKGITSGRDIVKQGNREKFAGLVRNIAEKADFSPAE